MNETETLDSTVACVGGCHRRVLVRDAHYLFGGDRGLCASCYAEHIVALVSAPPAAEPPYDPDAEGGPL